MISLYQFIELSRAGLFALARRHGDVVRLRTALQALDRGVGDLGALLPMGTAELLRPWPLARGGDRTALALLAAIGTIPWSNACTEVFVPPDAGSSPVTVPMVGDLDGEGRCRCGCGYVLLPARPPNT